MAWRIDQSLGRLREERAYSPLSDPLTVFQPGRADQIWLISFMDYDLGFFDEEVGRVQPGPNPFVPEV